jgi:hypothetical protein
VALNQQGNIHFAPGNVKIKDFVGVCKIRWDRDSTEPAGEYTFFLQDGYKNELGTGFSVHKRIISAVKRVEFVHDRMSHIILRGDPKIG